MVSKINGPSRFSFSTDQLSVAERRRAVCELYERGHFPMKVSPLRETVDFQVTRRVLPGLGIVSANCAALSMMGLPEPRGANDDLCMTVILAGTSVTSQRGRQVTGRVGDALSMNREDGGFTIGVPARSRLVGLRVPRAAIAPLVPNVDDVIMQPIPSDAGGLRLLLKYVDVVAHDQSPIAAELSHLIATHVHDVMAIAIGASLDAAAIAETRGVRAARLRTIKADIAAHLGNCNLRIGAVAARHGITPRYVQKLFESDGVSYAEFVLNQRLARAHRILSDPRFRHRTISSIAFDVGFGDLSHFNHCFRRCYGATPTEIRAQAQFR